MTKKYLILILMLVNVLLLQAQTTQQLYYTLDSLIDHHSEIVAAKEARIQAITSGLRNVRLTDDQQYELNQRLYDEYLAFRFDSAFHYIHQNLEQQRGVGDANRFAASAVRMAHILSVSGLFERAQQLLDEVKVSELNEETLMEYYNQRGELNLYRSEMAQYSPYFMEYIDSVQHYRHLLLQVAPKQSFEYITNQASYICEKGDVDHAINMFLEFLPTLSIPPRDRRYSIVASTLAYFYGIKGNSDLQEYYLLLSATNDVQQAILENRALCELSEILLDRGEVRRAYTYLLRASNDAQLYGSRLRSVQIARLAPLITEAYDMERSQAQHRTFLLLIMISVIALLLLGLILFTLSLIRRRRKDNEKISRMNQELSCHNEEIQSMNSQMKESNRIKDEYIGRFLQLSSTLIHRGEERGKMLNRMARDRKLEDLYTELKSQRFVSESIQMFHQNFDTAFLNIYPNFIEEVNRLMQPDKQFELSADAGRLTTELRILALIRLGIDDNQNIADILRSSLTTIYTYRSKLKARATSKDTFEDDIRKIASY